MKQTRPKRRRRGTSFLDMTPAQRDQYVARFDREIDVEKDTKPLTPKQRALFEGARQRSAGSVYLLPVKGKLIDEAAKAARANGMTLDEFITEGIRGMVASSRR